MHLQGFLAGSRSSVVGCWDWSHRRITRPDQPWCDGREFSSSCNKVRDFVPLLLIHLAPLKTVHGKVLFVQFWLADNWVCQREECGNQVIKDAMVQLKIGPTSRKGYHRDTCVVLDADNICLMSFSNHHFVPSLLEVVNDATVVQEIIEELLGEFAGKTCVLLYCCPNFTPKPLSMY